MAERVSGSLAADTVETVQLTVDADKTSTYINGAGASATKTINNRASGVMVVNVTGEEAIYFTVDGTAPTVQGEGCYVVAARAGAGSVVNKLVDDEITVKLIADNAVDYHVAFEGDSYPYEG